MSNAKSKRMKRIFAMQRRTEERRRAIVAEAQRRVDGDRAELEAVENQLAALADPRNAGVAGGPDLNRASDANDAAAFRATAETMAFGRLLIESGMAASARRREVLAASLANLETEFEQWQAEYRRATSLEKMVERITEQEAQARAKAEEAELEELALTRRAMAASS